MNIHIQDSYRDVEGDFEIIERKCAGHPDTLADRLAEYLSSQYSMYTKKKFGAVLHHNFDKVGLLGGASYVTFGKGYMTSPIRVLINGRVSAKFGGERIPARKLITKWTQEFFKLTLPLIDPEEDIDITFNLSSQSSPGKVYEKEERKSTRKHWFEPKGLEDLSERKKLVSNDTSMGAGYFPFSRTERLVLQIDSVFDKERKKHKWIGTDIKIMAIRNKNELNVTICIPQIANYVASIEAYIKNLAVSKKIVERLIKTYDFERFEVVVNNRDNFENRELYLTAIGRAIESGDEGLVGRGNRVNGLITPTRPMSMEGASGKNPVYHIGKLYYIGSFKLAEYIYKKYKLPCEVFLVSQTGRSLVDPWQVVINVPRTLSADEQKALSKDIEQWLQDLPKLTNMFLQGKILTA